MKKIAVLGAGIYNIQVYKTLNKAGFYTLAIDANPNAPAQAFAHQFACVNFGDKEQLLAFIQQNPVDAIMPINDWGTQSAAYVSAKLGLVGISEQAALNATDKGKMRDTWQAAGVPNPKYVVFSSLAEIQEKIDQIGFPCVIKPTDSGGSGRGISVLQSIEDLAWAFQFAAPYVRNNRFICEEFVQGTELTVETISQNGEVTILACSDKEKPEMRTRVAMSLNYPAKLSLPQKEYVYNTVKKAVKALGITTGMAHTEVIINGQELKMVETGARGGGGHIFHTIIEAVSGISAPVALAQILTNEYINLNNIAENGSVYRFFTVPHGILLGVKGIEEIAQWPGVLDIGMIKQIGQEVGNLKNSLERAGHVITAGQTREDAIELANRAEANIVWDIQAINE